MIQHILCGRSRTCKSTGAIVLECVFGIDPRWNRRVYQQSFDLGGCAAMKVLWRRSRQGIFLGSAAYSRGGRSRVSCYIIESPQIWVGGLIGYTINLECESISNIPTVASAPITCALQSVFFRKVICRIGLNNQKRFDIGCRAEHPATTTVALILDRRHDTPISPINRSR